ncbi:MAG: glycerol-3-phosphate 1-O-acyltransferase PlsY [Arenimonas sp.]|nr:glycerol-3-phosphate 1-O-acyltransferase PlsY [Arenimonas sp.]MBP7981709.1 glycerol-3-phosphate 1-O-acyltransferase PlsY [Arenimonas sp.]
MILAWLIVLSYLLGSASGSLLLGRMRGVDIRTLGSGNAGGTNALRTQGLKFALGVAVIDVGKGMLAAYMAHRWLPDSPQAALLAVFAAVLGHIWPVFHGFRGGKGAATLVGGLLLVWPQALLVVLGVWLLCLLLSGYVGLSTVLAAISLMASAYFFEASSSQWLFAIATALLLTFSHRSNLHRLRQGNESRFEKARILGRLLFGRRG